MTYEQAVMEGLAEIHRCPCCGCVSNGTPRLEDGHLICPCPSTLHDCLVDEFRSDGLVRKYYRIGYFTIQWGVTDWVSPDL